MTSDGIERLTHFQVKALARDLRALVIELEAERDALLRHCVQWNAFDGTWEAMVDPTEDGWEWQPFGSEAEARAAVRKAAGLDRGEG